MAEYKLSYTGAQIDAKLRQIDGKANASDIPTKVSELENDSGFITSAPVTSVNGKTGVVNLSASDVGALPNTTQIPSIDGLATEDYVDNAISAIPTPDVSGQINTHNTATNTHNDIRLLIEGLTTRLNTLADSDDTTLDQMSEVVAYIKSNKSLIESITTNKVNVSDIINNLTTNVTNKPLSAAQGVTLKALIDAIVVPTKVSELTNDKNYLTTIPSEYVTETELNAKKYLTSFTETDPTVPAWAKAAAKPTYTADEVNAVSKTGWAANKNLGTDANGNVIEKNDIFSKDTSAWSPVEYMGSVSWTELGYFWQSNGTHTNTQYTQKYQSTSELIKIEPNASYTLSAFNGVYFLYDANGKNGVQSTEYYTPATPLIFETNENQHYIGISHMPIASFPVTRLSLVRTTISESEYNSLPTQANTLKTLYGKNIVCLGDSLFGMYRGDTSTPAHIANITGATVHNCGFGGCRMSVHPTSGYAAFSMWALAKAIAENNWTTQDAQVSSGQSYFTEHLNLLKSLDFNDVDIAVIHYGTNDFGGGNAIQLDNASDHDDYNTLCGALRYSIEKLLGKYPKLKIYISLPVFRFWTTNGVTTYSDTYLNHGKKLTEFVEALRSTAAEYNLPVIDGYYGLGVNKANASTFLEDGTHHNADGRKRFGEYIGANLIAQQITAKSDGYSRKEIDSMFGSYVNDIATLVGGDA